MQHFTFTLREDGTNGDEWIVRIPATTHALSIEGDLSLDELCDNFQMFVQGCGYHLKSGARIGVIEEE
jgi:hypothetical protein